MAQYANTRGLNNYNYVDGQHLCVLLKCFPSLKSKIFLSRYSSRMSTCSDPDRPDTDDENSQRSYSNASSPSGSLQQTPNYVSLSFSQKVSSFISIFPRRFSRPPEVRSSLFRIPLSPSPEPSLAEVHPPPPQAPLTPPQPR